MMEISEDDKYKSIDTFRYHSALSQTTPTQNSSGQRSAWKEVSRSHKLSLALMLLIAISLPVSVFYTLSPKQILAPAAKQPVTPPGQVSVQPVSELLIRKLGNSLVLTWSAQDIPGVRYNVYRATTPYFTPDASNRIANVKENSYMDTTSGIVGDTTLNYYYAVTANKGNQESGVVNFVGEFDYELSSGPSTSINWIALPLSVDEIKTASDLVSYIEGNSNNPVTISSVAFWDASTQSLISYSSSTGSSNFVVNKQGVYMVELAPDQESFVWTLAGAVPPVGTYSYQLVETPASSFNWIMLPLNYGQITLASELKSEIESVASPAISIQQVSKWNTLGQNYQIFTTIPFVTGDFSLIPGYPYRLSLDVLTGNSSNWP
jgi:hypothetical protein